MSNPDTERDELRKILNDLFDDGRIAYSNDKSPLVCQQYIDRAEALIQAHYARQEAEIRIDELKNLPQSGIVAIDGLRASVIKTSVIKERIAQLTSQAEQERSK